MRSSIVDSCPARIRSFCVLVPSLLWIAGSPSSPAQYLHPDFVPTLLEAGSVDREIPLARDTVLHPESCFVLILASNRISLRIRTPGNLLLDRENAESHGFHWKEEKWPPRLGAIEDGSVIEVTAKEAQSAGDYTAVLQGFLHTPAVVRIRLDRMPSPEEVHEIFLSEAPGVSWSGVVTMAERARGIEIKLPVADAEKSPILDILLPSRELGISVTAPGGKVFEVDAGKTHGEHWAFVDRYEDLDGFGTVGDGWDLFNYQFMFFPWEGVHLLVGLGEISPGEITIRVSRNRVRGPVTIRAAYIPFEQILDLTWGSIDKKIAAWNHPPPGFTWLLMESHPKAVKAGEAFPVEVSFEGEELEAEPAITVRMEVRRKLAEPDAETGEYGQPEVVSLPLEFAALPERRYRAEVPAPPYAALLRLEFAAQGRKSNGQEFAMDVMTNSIQVLP